MFPSSNNSCNPFLYIDQTMFGIPYISEDNPHSKQEEHPFSFLHIPPSPLDPDDYDDGLLQHHLELLMANLLPQQQLLTANPTAAETVHNMVAATTNNDVIEFKPNYDGPSSFIQTKKEVQHKSKLTKHIPRKRSTKRDRHSKIDTAQGLRDRRVRLSVKIARKFFDLQDMLGFDKASKTVEWLLKESKAEIKELAIGLPQMKHSCSGGAKIVSSTSECEVVSGIRKNAKNGHQKGILSKGKSLAGNSQEKKFKQSRKVAFHPLARECRTKARARARERTSAKMWSRKLENSTQYPDGSPHNLDLLEFSSTFKTGEELGLHNHDVKPSFKVVVEVEEPWSNLPEYQSPVKHVDEEHFMILSNPSPSSIFNYQHIIATSEGVSCNNNNFPDLLKIGSSMALEHTLTRDDQQALIGNFL
ncbi:hypothetical protein HHK36_024324 [Tetracentron sinense]|uniref:Uncharacterized protein n=1 Tax=Tetracentron sinense TaxID=13715 RepID=A0A834YMZ6_TETSI|nr:hypothetical protein HHK36_024324 [Tetracentron sinense]